MVAKLERGLVDEKVMILMALAMVMKRGKEVVVAAGVVAAVVMGEGVMGVAAGVVGAVAAGVVGAVGAVVEDPTLAAASVHLCFVQGA